MAFAQVTFMSIFGVICFCLGTWLFVRRKYEFAWIGMFLLACLCVNALPFQMSNGIAAGGGLLAFLFLAGAYLLLRKDEWTASNTVGFILAVGCGAGWVNLYVWANNVPMGC